MAQRRMIDASIVDTDLFLNLPVSTQNLYFHLAVRVDDDGFVSKPLSLARQVSAKVKDLNLLEDNGYVLRFSSGVLVITAHNKHNQIRKDMYHPTVYLSERNMLAMDDNGLYRWRKDGDEPIRNRNESVTNPLPNKTNKHNKDNQINKDNQSTNKSGSDGLPDDSIFSSLSNNDKVQLRLKCQEHNCDMDALIRYVDNSIRNRKEQTEIRNPYKYIVQIGEGIGWNPEEGNNSYIPKHTPKDGFIRYGDIEGSIWDNLSDREKERIKYHYPKEGDVERAIKYADSVIAKNPDKEFEGNCADLIMNIVNHSWGVVSLKRD